MEIKKKSGDGKKPDAPSNADLLKAIEDVAKIKNHIPVRGEKGERGDAGYRGEKGDSGERGEKGIQGDKGLQGERGEKGDAGDRGEKGLPGQNGLQGEIGPRGARGPMGVKGTDGLGILSIDQNDPDSFIINFTDGKRTIIELPRGQDGKQIELRADGTMLQWHYVGDENWFDLFDLKTLGAFQQQIGAGPVRLKFINLTDVDPTNLTDTYVPAWDAASKKFVFVPNGSGDGGGDVFGPASSTNNAIAVFNGITGKAIKNSGAFVDGSGNISASNFSGSSSGTNTGDQDLSPYALIASLAAVALSGDYNDLINLPTLVTDHGALTGLGDDDHLQYHTDARALIWLGTRSTSDLPEGSNLYYTDERVDDRVAALIQNGTGITWTYNDVANTLTGNVSITQYTDEMAQDAIGAMIDGTLIYVDGTPLLTRAALTGDISAAQGSNVTVLATVNANVGSFGSGSNVGSFTVNAKGLITAASNVPISIASTAVTDFTEAAQDAIGAMIDTTLVYVDATPLLTRAAISGDITIAQGSNTAAITAGVIVDADINAGAAIAFSKLAQLAGLSVLGNSTNSSAVPSAITAASDDQVLRRSGTAIGFGAINLAAAAAVSGILAVGNGGLGIGSGTSGGVPYFSASNTIASSGALAANKVVIGGGAGAAPSTSGVNIDSNNNLSLFGPTINAQTGTTYTLQASDTGKIVTLSNASAITLTLPNSLNNFCCRIVQKGAGQVTLSPAGGATLNNRYSFTKTNGQWSELDLYVDSNSGGSSAVYVLQGDGTT